VPPHAWHLREAARRLHAGAVIAYPTEAVYGLGCDPLDAAAVERILALKQRPISSGLILIAADYTQIEPFLEPLPAVLRRKVFATWPGAVTWLLPARPEVPVWLRGVHDSLAVRVTAHAGSAALCTAFGGALVSTSANPHGRVPARSPLQVRRYFGDGLTYILPGPLGGRLRPSEIRDGRSGRVVRTG
jgi:L-threonylcarbamoyladenylate synthase